MDAHREQQQSTSDFTRTLTHPRMANTAISAVGIRHRRNQLSVNLYGEPGHCQTVEFEQAPPPSYRGLPGATRGYRGMPALNPAAAKMSTNTISMMTLWVCLLVG